MGARTVVVIVLSLVCGLAAVVGGNQLLKINNGGETASAVETVPVVVAGLDIERGTLLTEGSVEIRQVAESLRPPGAITSIEDVVGRTCITEVMQGDTFTEKKLSQPGSGQGMAALIPPGMRAFSIHTPTVGSGVAGFVMPGNKVDILLTVTARQPDDTTGGGSTTLLLQNVEVLAVDNRIGAPTGDADAAADTSKTSRTVTLAVTPDQANKLSLAQKKGTLDLALRNSTDNDAAKVQKVSFLRLLDGGERPLRDEAEAADDHTVPVVVAALDIGRGERIEENVVVIRRWPEDLVPEGAIHTIEEATGRIVASSLVRDELLIDRKLTGKGGSGGIASLIPKGMRAYTILTPTIASGVGGFVLPGNRVDVLLTVTDGSKQIMRHSPGGVEDNFGGGTTTTLLQLIEILAVDQRLDAPAANKVNPEQLRSVTLLVSPSQAAMLSLSQKKGTLHLSLRGQGDTDTANVAAVSVRELRLFAGLAGSDPKETKLEPSGGGGARLRIRTLRGSQHGEIRVFQPASSTPITAGANGKTE